MMKLSSDVQSMYYACIRLINGGLVSIYSMSKKSETVKIHSKHLEPGINVEHHPNNEEIGSG